MDFTPRLAAHIRANWGVAHWSVCVSRIVDTGRAPSSVTLSSSPSRLDRGRRAAAGAIGKCGYAPRHTEGQV